MSWSKLVIAAIWASASLVLAACGFEPVYGSREGVETTAEMASIKINPIEERLGQMLRNNLLDSMNPRGEPSQVKYRLETEISEVKQELAVRKSELATRSNMNLTARYRLFDVSRNAFVMTRMSTVTASYNLLTNEFATLAAEADARERGMRDLSDDITRQIALYFRAQAKSQAQSQPKAAQR
jgi:LPS-assembly lipoprotein